MKIIAFLLIAAMTSCSSISFNKTLSFKFGDKVDSIFYLSAKNKEGKSFRATGVAIGPDKILTVSHLVHGSNIVTINKPFKKQKAKIDKNYESADFLILKPKNIILNFFDLKQNIIKENDVVFVVTATPKIGTVWKKTQVKDISRFEFRIQGNYPKGTSGSVVISKNGSMLGILTRSNCEEVSDEKYGVVLRSEGIIFMLYGEV